MADGSPLEFIDVQVRDVPLSEAFRHATTELKHGIPTMSTLKEGVISADTILQSVLKWENAHLDKVESGEIGALILLSEVIGSMDMAGGLERMDKPEMNRLARIKMIEAQRTCVTTVLHNMKSDEFPNDQVFRAMSLITQVFEDTLLPQPDRFYEKGLEKYAFFWQGVMGMTTAAQMFIRSGWKVGFGPIDLDLESDVDLIVRNPKGDVFTVDVASKFDRITHGDAYKTDVSSEKNLKVLTTLGFVSGRILINIPPLRDLRFESFYDPEHRATGTPSKASIAKFKNTLGNYNA